MPNCPIISLFSYYSAFIPIISGIFVYNKLRREYNVLFFYYAFMAVIGLSEMLCVFFQRTNIWIGNISTLIEFTVLPIILSFWLKDERMKKIFYLSIILYYPIWIGGKFLGESMNTFPTYTRSIMSIILVIMAVYTFYSISKEWSGNILSDARFWILSSIMIYYSGSFFVLGLANSMWDDLYRVLQINSALNVIANLFYAIAMFCVSKKPEPAY